MAAQSSVALSWKNPALTIDVNINVLDQSSVFEALGAAIIGFEKGSKIPQDLFKNENLSEGGKV